MTTHALFRTVAAPAADSELLARFISARDEAAFAELVRRYGAVVYRVCRRIVGPTTADDAFQATFLVLATRAGSVRKAASVGSWLFGVAGRVARQMRRKQASGLRERAGDLDNLPAHAGRSPEVADLAAVLDDELTRLPDTLRAVVVSCLVRHRTHQQAAAELGQSERTLRRRLDEAKRLLRERLERRGVVPVVAAAVVSGVGTATANVPRELTDRAVALVLDFLAGGAAVASAPAVIAKGVGMTLMSRMAKAVLVSAAVGLTALGVGLAGDPPKAAEKPAVDDRIPPTERKEPTRPNAPPVEADSPFAPKLTWTYHGPSTEAKTKNFVVKAPDPVIARAVANEAEHQRKALAERWLGKELPAWEKPCPIQVTIDPAKNGGATTFTFGEGDKSPKLKSLEMTLFGSFEQILRSQLPHEVTHCVLASHFGQPLPRWADEGIALQSDPAEDQARHDWLCRQLLNDGRGIQVKHLLTMKEYPKDAKVLYAQGHSLVRFLLQSKPLPTLADESGKAISTPEQILLTFVAIGMSPKSPWDAAAKEMYGFADLDALQEAWIDWLRKPESSLGNWEAKPAAEKKGDALIPPTKLGK